MQHHVLTSCLSMTSIEVQQQRTTWVKIRLTIPPSHAPPGFSIVAHMSVKVFLKNVGIPRWQFFQDSSRKLQEGWVICSAVWLISNHTAACTRLWCPFLQVVNRLGGWSMLFLWKMTQSPCSGWGKDDKRHSKSEWGYSWKNKDKKTKIKPTDL